MTSESSRNERAADVLWMSLHDCVVAPLFRSSDAGFELLASSCQSKLACFRLRKYFIDPAFSSSSGSSLHGGQFCKGFLKGF